MTMLERITRLIRANLNDLIDKAEDPEKMIKQVILDMESELKQLKNQLAVSIADQEMLEKQHKEHSDKTAEWMNRAERSVDRNEEELARAALERYVSCKQLAESYETQVAEQKKQVESLKGMLRRLEQKLAEARAAAELLVTRRRRSRAAGKATEARVAVEGGSSAAAFDRLESDVRRAEAVARAKAGIEDESLDARLIRMEEKEKIDGLLAEIKNRRSNPKP